eukprot:g2259.t1
MGRKRAKTGGDPSTRRRATEPAHGRADAESDDEIDAFHAKRDEVSLNAHGAKGDREEESELDEAVMDINGSDETEDDEESEESEEESNSDDNDDEDDDSEVEEEESEEDDEEDEAERRKIDQMASNWGKSKRRFYGGDNQRLQLEAGDGDDERNDAKLEEEAAEELRRKQLDAMDEGDFAAQASSEDEGEDEDEDGDEDGNIYGNGGGRKAAVAVENVPRRAARMSKEDKLQIVLSDSPELVDLLQDLKEKMGEVQDQIEPLLARVGAGQLPTGGGLSYLEVKHQLLLNYCVNVVFYLLLKARGKSVQRHPVVTQLVEMRAIMERLRPLDRKLKYQVDKLLKAASRGQLPDMHADDPLRHRPRPEQLRAQGAGEKDEEDEEDDDGEGRTGAGAVYQAPKSGAVPYDLDERADTRARREAEKRVRRLGRSTMLRELREDMSDAPREVRERAYKDRRVEEEEEEKRVHEEERFVRLTATRKEKQRKKHLEREAARVDTIADVGDFSELQGLADAGVLGADADGGAGGAGRAGGGDAAGSTVARLRDDQRRMNRFQKLHKTLNVVKQKAQGRPGAAAAAAGGDVDVPLHDPDAAAKIRIRNRAGAHDAEDSDAFGVGGGLSNGKRKGRGGRQEQHALYAAAQSSARAKKKAKRDRVEHASAAAFGGDAEAQASGKRGVTWEIMKNQGLKAQKRKIDRNPRVKKRVQYKKAMIRRKGQVREVRTNEGDQYGGELTGISSKVTRSRRL